MSYVNGLPNPSGSPNEKIEAHEIPQSHQLGDIFMRELLRHNAFNPEQARAIGEAYKRVAEAESFERHEVRRQVEAWANTHTHAAAAPAIDPGPGDPSALTLLGSLEDTTYFQGSVGMVSMGDNQHVAVCGYTGTGTAYMTVVDISDPTTPVAVGQVTETGVTILRPGFLKRIGDYVTSSAHAVSSSSLKLGVWDLSDLTAPVLLGSVGSSNMLARPHAIHSGGQYAHIAGNQHFITFDISNPASPTLDNTISALTSGWAYSINRGWDDVTLVSGGTSSIGRGARAIDVTDPTAPSVGSVISSTSGHDVHGVYMQDGYALAVNNSSSAGGYHAIDSVPSDQHQYTDANLDLAEVGDLASDHLYLPVTYGGNDGFAVINVADPTSPTHINDYSDALITAKPFCVQIVSEYVVVGSPTDTEITVWG